MDLPAALVDIGRPHGMKMTIAFLKTACRLASEGNTRGENLLEKFRMCTTKA